jgi:hypothetical protein
MINQLEISFFLTPIVYYIYVKIYFYLFLIQFGSCLFLIKSIERNGDDTTTIIKSILYEQ